MYYFLVRKDMDVNEYERLSTLHLDKNNHSCSFQQQLFLLSSFKIWTKQKKMSHLYSETCIKRSPLEQRKSGLIRQVTC